MTRAVDYTICRREILTASDVAGLRWDVFWSAYNGSDRVQEVMALVQANAKHWLLHPEYRLPVGTRPDGGDVFAMASRHEIDFWVEYWGRSGEPQADVALGIDITGMMRPHVMTLVRLLFDRGLPRFDMVYSEPSHYRQGEHTLFSQGGIREVRQVAGFEGLHVPATERDVLVVGTGYDHAMLRAVTESKEHARKVQVFGLPSLRPDMYQENVLRVARVTDSLGTTLDHDVVFAPASDPFVTAELVGQRIDRIEDGTGCDNLYITSLGTKPQALGLALYYVTERVGSATSIIFPFYESYNSETTSGISRVWVFHVERL